jgi:cytochrome c oxidase assembly protein subunit 15
MSSFLRPERSRAVAIWLFVMAALVFAMVVVGGATRLTGSGLSITEWRPIDGALPPLSAEAWAAEFAKYRRIPQYIEVNRGMSLEDFKGLYWWEWGHRFLGRLVGVAFAIPFLVFVATRRIPQRLIWRCVVLFALGGLQGLVGWWMVYSGLSERVDVAPERLAVHLGLALVLFGALIWTGLEAWFGKCRRAGRGRWPNIAVALAAAIFVQIILGALVAGNDAGLVHNDWPLMSGRFFPSDYADGGFWHTLVHSRGAVQFHHRIGGYLLFAAALAVAAAAWRAPLLPRAARVLAGVVAAAVTAQAALGIVTLIQVTPVPLAILHQAMAAVVLGAAVTFAWRVSRD